MLEEGIEILHEETNFFEWQSNILKVMRLIGVQDVITGDIHNSCKNEKAALLIIKNVSPKFLKNLQTCKTAKEMMLRLESHFCYKTVFEKLHIKKQLLNLNSEPFENLQSHFHKFDALMSKLKALNCEIGETDQVFHLLFTLLDRYDSLILSLDKSFRNALWENALTLDYIKTTLLDYEAALLAEMSVENDGNYSLLDCEEKNVLELCGDLTQQLHDKKLVSIKSGQVIEQISNDNIGLDQLQHNYENGKKSQSEHKNNSDIISTETVCVIPEEIQNDNCSLNASEDNGSGEVLESQVCETEHESMCIFQESKLECQRVFNCQVLLRDIAKDLHCLECNKWFLTPMQLTHHTETHNLAVTLPNSRRSKHNTNLDNQKSKIPVSIELESARYYIGATASTMAEFPSNAYQESTQIISDSPASVQQTVLQDDFMSVPTTDLVSNKTSASSTSTISSNNQNTSPEESEVLFDEVANLNEDVTGDYTEPLIYDDEEDVDKIVVTTAVSDLGGENHGERNNHTTLKLCVSTGSIMELNDNSFEEPISFETLLVIDNNTEDILDPVKNEFESKRTEIDCTKEFYCELKLRDISRDLLCSFCRRWFLSTQELKIHKLTHIQSQNSSISPSLYSLESSKYGTPLPFHITDVHTDEDFESNEKNQSPSKTKENVQRESSQDRCNIKSNLTCNICQKVLSCEKSLAQHLNTHRNILKLSLSKLKSHSDASNSNVPDYQTCNEIIDKTSTSTSKNKPQSSKQLNNSKVSDIIRKSEILTKSNKCYKSSLSASGQLLITKFLDRSRETTAEIRSPKVTQSTEKSVTSVLEDAGSEHIDIQLSTVSELSETSDCPTAESERSPESNITTVVSKFFEKTDSPQNQTKLLNCNVSNEKCTIGRPYYYCHLCRTPITCEALEKHLKTHNDNRVAATITIIDSLSVYTPFNAFNRKEKRGDCDICSKPFSSQNHAQMLIHRDTHTGLKSHACDLCDKRYSDENSLNTHIQHEHSKYDTKLLNFNVSNKNCTTQIVPMKPFNSPTRYQCNYCNKSYMSKQILRTHIVRCQILFERPCYCHVCRKPFNRKDLDKHLKTHDDNKIDGQEYSAEGTTTTERTEYLLVHTTFNAFNENEIVNKKEKSVTCDICGRPFGSRYSAHMLIHRDTHTGFKLHACDLCGKRYSHKETLNTHIRHKHSLEKPYACEVCGKKFGANKFYQKHKLTHTERSYPCKFCFKTYTRQDVLDHHVMRKHEKRFPFSCLVCNKRFSRKVNLKSHSVVHKEKSCICPICGKSVSTVTFKTHCDKHNTNNNKVFECDICGYKTNVKQGLVGHIARRHTTGQKPFKCNVCKKRFKLKMYLDRHKPIHAKDGQKYSCSVCGQGFFHKHTWARHMRTPHSDRTPRLKVMLKE